jgi:hypothetical protein
MNVKRGNGGVKGNFGNAKKVTTAPVAFPKTGTHPLAMR